MKTMRSQMVLGKKLLFLLNYNWIAGCNTINMIDSDVVK